VNEEEEDESTETGPGFRMNLHKRPFSKNSHQASKTNFNPHMKHMPDHLATKLVDDILNAKFS
jgi:hypothetical protein